MVGIPWDVHTHAQHYTYGATLVYSSFFKKNIVPMYMDVCMYLCHFFPTKLGGLFV